MCDNNSTAKISFKNLRRVAKEFDERVLVTNEGIEEMTDEEATGDWMATVK